MQAVATYWDFYENISDNITDIKSAAGEKGTFCQF